MHLFMSALWFEWGKLLNWMKKHADFKSNSQLAPRACTRYEVIHQLLCASESWPILLCSKWASKIWLKMTKAHFFGQGSESSGVHCILLSVATINFYPEFSKSLKWSLIWYGVIATKCDHDRAVNLWANIQPMIWQDVASFI